jgi:hypothetical protein
MVDARRDTDMRRLITLTVPVILALAGCNRFAGPLEVWRMDRADALGPDGRPYTSYEQEVRARERYTIPTDDWGVAPPLNVGKVGPTGR